MCYAFINSDKGQTDLKIAMDAVANTVASKKLMRSTGNWYKQYSHHNLPVKYSAISLGIYLSVNPS